MSEIDYKVCFYCKEEKPYSAFRKDPQKSDGCTSRCKSCINKPTIPVDYSKITHKVCVVCNIDKDYSLYHKKTKNGRVTVQSKCKECTTEYKKKRYWGNHDAELAKMTKSRLKPENVIQRKGYYKKNKSEYQKRYKKYQSDENKRLAKLENSKNRYQQNKESIRKRHRLNYHKPEVKKRLRERERERMKTDVGFVITKRLRRRLAHIVKSIGGKEYKAASTFALLGCNIEQFKIHIESKFTQDMSWENVLNGAIHIDHIKPCAKFDLKDPEQQKECFSWQNLQPLWWYDNLSKGAKLDYKIAS